MSRAPFVVAKANHAFDRSPKMFDTTTGWRFINKKLDREYGTGSLPAMLRGLNDASTALLLASEAAARRHDLEPKARVLGTAVTGVPPRILGIGPVPATTRPLKRIGIKLDDIDIIEMNEAFSAQTLACTRQLGLNDDDPRINPQGGAIALGHPLRMSGSRLVITAMYQL